VVFTGLDYITVNRAFDNRPVSCVAAKRCLAP
jgi:hypothetical protein